MMKPQPIPKHYLNDFCNYDGIIACDYLMHRDCNRKCDFAKQFHPVERAKFLAQKDALEQMSREGLDLEDLGRRE